MPYMSEAYLTKKYISKKEWQTIITTITNYTKNFQTWKLFLLFEKNTVTYLIETPFSLDPSLNGIKTLLIKQTNLKKFSTTSLAQPKIFNTKNNLIDIKNNLNFKHQEQILLIEITFKKLFFKKTLSKVLIKTKKNTTYKTYKILFPNIPNLLEIDYESNYNLLLKTPPKYLDITASLHLLTPTSKNQIFEIDTFPYLKEKYYLNQEQITFAKHSIVFGASGSGKSKFLSLLISSIFNNKLLNQNYKVIIIDPHDFLKHDIGALGTVIDFKDSTINLFTQNTNNYTSETELLLEVFKSTMNTNYNAKLEHLLRYSIYLLLVANKFNFENLRKLILDLEYRTDLLKNYKEHLPLSITRFFLTEFNEIKTKSYTEAIVPLISLIDELELLPSLTNTNQTQNLKTTIESNFLTIFSLDRTVLGTTITKTIASLIMQQLLTLVENTTFKEHIIFIVDEVPIIENPVLKRILSESRKYNLSLILAGQYFNGITKSLQEAIFANVINYYIFRLSKEDANLLAENLTMKIPLNNTTSEKVKLITTLQDRECLLRVSTKDQILPVLKGKTLNFKSIPYQKKKKENLTSSKEISPSNNTPTFSTKTKTSPKDLLKITSTSKK